jgi:hypothetical protein
MKCPCENCIVFPICNSQIQDEGTTKLVIIGLATTCPILMKFLTHNNTISLSFVNENVDTARRAFGWEVL